MKENPAMEVENTLKMEKCSQHSYEAYCFQNVTDLCKLANLMYKVYVNIANAPKAHTA